jgi:hypothetical protein
VRLAVRLPDERGLERIGLPKLDRIDRLHVVMSVEQDVRSAGPWPMRNDDGVAGRLAGRGIEAFGFQVLDQPVGGALHFTGIGRIGRDRLDADQRLQPLEALIEMGIDMGEGGIELGFAGHEMSG